MAVKQANSRIESFKTDISLSTLTDEQIFQKQLIDNDCYFFDVGLADKIDEYSLRQIIADSLEVHLNEVMIVGSAKVGFSLNPSKLFRAFDSKFLSSGLIRDKSDLDIAVISPELFNYLNINMFKFTNSFKQKWLNNEYYYGDKLQDFKVPISYKFFEYNLKGWFRPDFKPVGFELCKNGSFEELKRIVLQTTNRKLGLAIYKDWFYFKHYHLENIKTVRNLSKIDVL